MYNGNYPWAQLNTFSVKELTSTPSSGAGVVRANATKASSQIQELAF